MMKWAVISQFPTGSYASRLRLVIKLWTNQITENTWLNTSITKNDEIKAFINGWDLNTLISLNKMQS